MRWVLVGFILLACPQPASAQRLELTHAPTILAPEPAPAGFFRTEWNARLNRRLRDEEDSLLNGVYRRGRRSCAGGGTRAAYGAKNVHPGCGRSSRRGAGHTGWRGVRRGHISMKKTAVIAHWREHCSAATTPAPAPIPLLRARRMSTSTASASGTYESRRWRVPTRPFRFRRTASCRPRRPRFRTSTRSRRRWRQSAIHQREHGSSRASFGAC